MEMELVLYVKTGYGYFLFVDIVIDSNLEYITITYMNVGLSQLSSIID